MPVIPVLERLRQNQNYNLRSTRAIIVREKEKKKSGDVT